MAGNSPLAIAAFIISIITFVFNIIWTPFQKARTEQIRLSLDFRRRYTLEMQQHLDTVYSYEETQKRSQDGRSYYEVWQTRHQPDTDMGIAEKEVETATRILGGYWNELLECYDSGALPAGSWIPQWVPRGPFWVPKDMLSRNMLRKAEDYMRLVEPVDCAKWYRLGNHEQNKSKKDSTLKGDYSFNNPLRPGRYSKIEKLLEHEDREEWHEELQKIAGACKRNLSCSKPAEAV